MIEPSYLMVYVTCRDEEEANRLGTMAVDRGLAACANILPGVTSIFHYGGQTCRSEEVVVLLKTTAPKYRNLESRLKAEHSYNVPCIVAYPVYTGHKPYLQWISEHCVD